MNDLDAIEVRVLGSLIEKELTTPDQYPLSLNAIVLACNQKSNREPVMTIGEAEVMTALDSLMARHMAREKNSAGARVSKYAHRLSGGLGLSYSFDRNELGTLCILMLRGPQTPGEIRARSGRLCAFSGLADVEETLERLSTKDRGPYAVRLPRQPGRKEARHAHLMSGEPVVDYEESAADDGPQPGGGSGRIAALEARVDQLEHELAALRERLGDMPA